MRANEPIAVANASSSYRGTSGKRGGRLGARRRFETIPLIASAAAAALALSATARADVLQWTGATDNNWNTTSADWSDTTTGSTTTWTDDNVASFVSVTTGTTTITVQPAGVAPTSLNFTGGAYTFSGGDITTSAIASSGGTLKINNSLDSTTGLTVTGSTNTYLLGSSPNLAGTINDNLNGADVILGTTTSFGPSTNTIDLGGTAKVTTNSSAINSLPYNFVITSNSSPGIQPISAYFLSLTGNVTDANTGALLIGTPTGAPYNGGVLLEGTNNSLNNLTDTAGFLELKNNGGTASLTGNSGSGTNLTVSSTAGGYFQGQFVLQSGNATVHNLTANAFKSSTYYYSSVILNGGTLAITGTASLNLGQYAQVGGSGSFSGTISTGSGATVTAPLYVGNTTLTGGTNGAAGSAVLDLQGANATFTSGLVVTGAGVLEGHTSTAATSGSNAIEVQSGGAVSPGDSTAPTGTLTLTNLLLDNGSMLDYNLTTPGGSGSLLAITSGTLSLGSDVGLSLTDSGGLGTGVYELISYTGAVTGDGNLGSWTVLSGLPANETASFSDTGSQVDMTVSLVPEPDSAAVMILLLLGGLPMSRRLRRLET